MPETQFFLMPSDQKDILAEVFDRDPRVQLVVNEGLTTAGCQDEAEVQRRRQKGVMRAGTLAELLDWDFRDQLPLIRRFWLWHTEFAPGPPGLPRHGEDAYNTLPYVTGLIQYTPSIFMVRDGQEVLETGRFAVNSKGDFEYAHFARYNELRAYFESIRRIVARRFSKEIECWYRLWRGDGTWWRSKILKVSPAVWDAFSNGLGLREGNSPCELRKKPGPS